MVRPAREIIYEPDKIYPAKEAISISDLKIYFVNVVESYQAALSILEDETMPEKIKMISASGFVGEGAKNAKILQRLLVDYLSLNLIDQKHIAKLIGVGHGTVSELRLQPLFVDQIEG